MYLIFTFFQSLFGIKVLNICLILYYFSIIFNLTSMKLARAPGTKKNGTRSREKSKLSEDICNSL